MILILVLLINPPDRSEIRRSLNLRAPPLGLLYIAAALEKADFPTQILDANLYNLSDLQIEREISRRSPNIVGVTATTNLIKEAEKIVIIAKKVLPDVITVIGGVHATFLPIRTLNECPALDIVVIGEGEETMVELTKVLDQIMRKGGKYNSNHTYGELSKVKGIAYRLRNNQNEIKVTPPRPLITDLDKLPFPARHLVHYEHYGYLNRSILVGTLITSRGCPYNCTYCSSSILAGKRFRSRSADNVLDEIELLYTKYKIRRFEFLDDIFTLNQKRAFEFARKVRERALDITWEASSRVDTVTKELIHELRKSGLSTIYYGVESGSQRILDLMQKRITLEQIEKAFKITKEAKIKVLGSFMIGYPGETLDEMKQTIKFSIKLDPDYAQFCVTTPYPGTALYKELELKGLLATYDWSKYTALNPVIKYEEFGYSMETVKRMITRCYISFYLRPKYYVKHKYMIPTFVYALMNNFISNLRYLSYIIKPINIMQRIPLIA